MAQVKQEQPKLGGETVEMTDVKAQSAPSTDITPAMDDDDTSITDDDERESH